MKKVEIGQRFGILTVIACAGTDKHQKRLWRCICDCGSETLVDTGRLNAGKTRSCGCGIASAAKVRHAGYRVPAFWARVRRAGPDDCWEWTGYRRRPMPSQLPYGELGFEGRVQHAHRVAYLLEVGPIPDDAMVLHRCDNPPCCNPAHLYLGDQARNMADMKDRKRRQKVADEVRERVRSMYRSGMFQKDIAAAVGISQSTVSYIARGMSNCYDDAPDKPKFHRFRRPEGCARA